MKGRRGLKNGSVTGLCSCKGLNEVLVAGWREEEEGLWWWARRGFYTVAEGGQRGKAELQRKERKKKTINFTYYTKREGAKRGEKRERNSSCGSPDVSMEGGNETQAHPQDLQRA